MTVAKPLPQILILGDGLSREGLKRWLIQEPPLYRLVDSPEQLDGAPRLILWSLTTLPPANMLFEELRLLQERWHPAPLLMLSSGALSYPRPFLLDLPVQGLLEAPDAASVREAVSTLLEGGRVVDLLGSAGDSSPWRESVPMGLGQWLLVSGLQQIDAELRVCRQLLNPPPTTWLAQMLLEGRCRELQAARSLLLWLWGPLTMAWGFESPPELSQGDALSASAVPPSPGVSGTALAPVLSLTLRQRNAEGIWRALRQRLQDALAMEPANMSGQLLAFDGLQEQRRRDLLLALLEQLDHLRATLQEGDQSAETLRQRWAVLQPQLRQQALRQMAGPYVQLPRDGALQPVAETLLSQSDLEGEDPELPDPHSLLAAVLQARPLVVEGRLRAPDEPQAVLYLEMLLANWLVRNAEQISSQVLALSAEWPELRRYLLRDNLLPTRNLERLRNQLNAQERWLSWVERPIQLYESRRPLFCLKEGGIGRLDLTEPRDRELRRLSWPQQLVTLALEVRDALAPQAQAIVRALGDLFVVFLTRVVGRAIGLVGRGIAQGMGRSLGR
ncbi:MAG: DUF3685 domain-containing protein [Cyanobacteriota bacterium]|nr:DUF3685 domain-containing protein [Cyanobacteriota bacterium]